MSLSELFFWNNFDFLKTETCKFTIDNTNAEQTENLCLNNTHFIYFCLFILLFKAAPTAHGSSQARCHIGVMAAGLHHSHSNTGSEPCLWPTPQLTAMPDPWPRARNRTHILMDTSQICFHCSTMETPCILIFVIIISN